MSDYYNGSNRAEDAQVKLGEKVQNWWNSLDYGRKEELMEDHYPDAIVFCEPDELFEGLDWKDKLAIYYEVNSDELLTEKEKADNIGDKRAHEIMEREGRIE